MRLDLGGQFSSWFGFRTLDLILFAISSSDAEEQAVQ